MKRRFIIYCLIFIVSIQAATAQSSPVIHSGASPWWKQNNLRVIQVNLPAYEAATLNPDSLLADLKNFSANTLIINAGGIMAFYPTRLPFQYTNPYMKKNMLGDVIAKCHANGIKVIVRFDFSRVQESIFKEHPDWCYISAAGERIINTDMYVVSINAPYVQEKAFDIIDEVMQLYPIDGVFLNMPGYQTRNAYEGKYHGIDQNEYDKKAFYEYSHEMKLPVEEKKDDPVFQQYTAFKKATVEAWSKKLHELIKSHNPDIAICTYLDKYVDIIRHESQSNGLPYWPYSASDNVGNAGNSYPDHIISNSSIQQVSFQSRFNAVEPEEVAIRLYENIANGSGLDISMMGDLRGYEDERNYETIKKIYGFHKKYEPYFGNYTSVARLAVIAPGSWPSGEPMQEYRGILLMLKEAHIPFDIIEDAQIVQRADRIKQYKLIILPDITYIGTEAVNVLKEASRNGTNLVATNKTLSDDSTALKELFGARMIKTDYEGSGNYLGIDQRAFKRLKGQQMILWKFNLAQYDLTGADTVFLPVLSKGRPGPPEIVGGHDPTGFYGMALKKYGAATNGILPENMGKIYYQLGYKEHKNILLDIIDRLYPEAGNLIQTNAPERVETILKEYRLNTAAGRNKKTADGLILHLVNITGFSGNSYFKPLTIDQLSFAIRTSFKPSRIYQLATKKQLPFTWNNSVASFNVNQLGEFDSIVIEK